jgi:hypothetical protein
MVICRVHGRACCVEPAIRRRPPCARFEGVHRIRADEDGGLAEQQSWTGNANAPESRSLRERVLVEFTAPEFSQMMD